MAIDVQKDFIEPFEHLQGAGIVTLRGPRAWTCGCPIWMHEENDQECERWLPAVKRIETMQGRPGLMCPMIRLWQFLNNSTARRILEDLGLGDITSKSLLRLHRTMETEHPRELRELTSKGDG